MEPPEKSGRGSPDPGSVARKWLDHGPGTAGVPPRSRVVSVGMEGTLLVLAFAPFVLGAWAHGASVFFQVPLLGATTAAATALFLAGSVWFFRRPTLGKACTALAIVAGLALLVPSLHRSPSALLAAVVVTLVLLYLAFSHCPARVQESRIGRASRAAMRARYAGFTALPLLLGVAAFYQGNDPSVAIGAAICGLVPAVFAAHWAFRAVTGRRRVRAVATGLACLVTGVALLVGRGHGVWLDASIGWPLVAILLVPAPRPDPASLAHGGTWWEPFLGHPARLLVFSFLGLCAAGAVALATPAASATGQGVDPVDAVFTSVSAVCVTGLIVLDTPVDFSGFGQACILVLIQIGGLGIMSIYVLALHAFGRRLSLRHERVLAATSSEDRGRLFESLRLVVLFALVVEGLGIAMLLPCFLGTGDPWPAALWRAVFTAVSAFCNAGFALQSDSLLGYQSTPAVLHIVALLIILGGLSPAVTVGIPGLVRSRSRRPVVHLVVVTTLLLLASGWFLFCVFEWNATLKDMSIPDRIHNAWFQSVTLRTAGFNSVDIAEVQPSTFLVMLVFMFVGGSPGGTAGGIKTTTFAVLVVGMLSAFRGRERLVVRGRSIGHGTVYKALAVVAAGLAVWMTAVIALHLLQSIPTRDIVFEVTSALGTVGLTTGATAQLDGAGKVIIMIVMFVGRIGPLTMFTILSHPGEEPRVHHPEVKIPIA